MKKSICMTIGLALCFALCACSSNTTESEAETMQPVVPETVATEATAYSEETVLTEYADTDDDGQNPVMNFIGEYQCGRANALVECYGSDEALITIDWGGSANDLARWEIIGHLDMDTLTIDYTNGSEHYFTYDDTGALVSDEILYEDGAGTVTFNNDGTFTWHEATNEAASDMIFEWVPVEAN